MATLYRLGHVATRMRLAESGSSVAMTAEFTTSAIVTAKGVAKVGKKQVMPKKAQPKVAKWSGKGNKSKPERRGDHYYDGSSLGIPRSNQFVERAPDLSHLPEFLPENVTPENVNQLMIWPKKTLAAISPNAFSSPSTFQRTMAFQHLPKTLIRPCTIELIEMIKRSKSEAMPNTIFNAPEFFGASTLALQGVSYALESSAYLVIYFPKVHHLLDSSSSYVYSERHQSYLQPELARRILECVMTVNESILAKVSYSGETVELDGKGAKIESGSNLANVIRSGLRSSNSADALQTLFEVAFKTIVQQKQVPVLFAIDGVQALFGKSVYRDPDYRQLWSYELGVPRTLLACLRRTGAGSFGGVQSGLTVTSLAHNLPNWKVSNEMRAVLPIRPAVDPYTETDANMVQIIQECQFNMWNLYDQIFTREEAAALLNAANEERLLIGRENDEFLMSKLITSGGSIGRFCRSIENSIV